MALTRSRYRHSSVTLEAGRLVVVGVVGLVFVAAVASVAILAVVGAILFLVGWATVAGWQRWHG